MGGEALGSAIGGALRGIVEGRNLRDQAELAAQILESAGAPNDPTGAQLAEVLRDDPETGFRFIQQLAPDTGMAQIFDVLQQRQAAAAEAQARAKLYESRASLSEAAQAADERRIQPGDIRVDGLQAARREHFAAGGTGAESKSIIESARGPEPKRQETGITRLRMPNGSERDFLASDPRIPGLLEAGAWKLGIPTRGEVAGAGEFDRIGARTQREILAAGASASTNLALARSLVREHGQKVLGTPGFIRSLRQDAVAQITGAFGEVLATAAFTPEIFTPDFNFEGQFDTTMAELEQLEVAIAFDMARILFAQKGRAVSDKDFERLRRQVGLTGLRSSPKKTIALLDGFQRQINTSLESATALLKGETPTGDLDLTNLTVDQLVVMVRTRELTMEAAQAELERRGAFTD